MLHTSQLKLDWGTLPAWQPGSVGWGISPAWQPGSVTGTPHLHDSLAVHCETCPAHLASPASPNGVCVCHPRSRRSDSASLSCQCLPPLPCRHHTATSAKRSLAGKLFVAQFVNTALSTVVANVYLPILYRKIGQVASPWLFQGVYSDLVPAWYAQVGRGLIITLMLMSVLLPCAVLQR